MSSIDDKGDSSSKRIEEACKSENKNEKVSDVMAQHKIEEQKHSCSSFSKISNICLGNEERTSKNDEEISKSAGTDEELSSDTQEDEIKLRWDDDDSQDLPAQTIEPDETIEEQGKSVLNNSNTPDGDISGETSSLSTISLSTDTKSYEHGLNKPDMMLSIPENMFDKDKLKDFNADTSSDKDSVEEEDNNLSDLLSKVNAEIAETVAAIDEDDDMDCELQLSPDEDTVETQLKETTTESEEHIDEEKENELLSESFEEVDETKANMDTAPEIVNSSVTEAIVKEVSATDAMSSIDNLEKPESSDISSKNLLVQENKNKVQDIDVKMPMTCNVDNMIPDTHDSLIPSDSELRKKDMSLKISTLISSIEGEMQLLDAQDEIKSPENTEKTDEDIVEVSSMIKDIEEEIQLLDDNEITSSETTKKNDDKISSSSIQEEIQTIDDKELTRPISKKKKDFADKLPSLISDLEEQIKLLDSNEEENDIEKCVTDSENDKIGEEITDIVDNDKEQETKDKEILESSKDEDEIARAIKAIETDNDSLEPLQPAVLKVTDELSEISVLEETDQPSISLVLDDDDDSIEEVQNDVPMSVDESEVSVIPDSDDEAILILDGENETDDAQKDGLMTAEIKEHEKTEIQIDVEKINASKMGTGELELKEDLPQLSQDNGTQNINISTMDNNLPTSTITEDKSTNDYETGKGTVSEIEKGLEKIDLQNIEQGMNRKLDNLLDQSSTSNIEKQDIEMETHSSTKTDKDTLEKKDPSQNVDEPKPSTSTAELDLNRDSSNDAQEHSDQLDLLTESTRNRDEDEEQEDDDDDSDDFSHDDESSNLMTAEHSDDSNAPTSEVNQEKLEKQIQSEFIDSSDNARDANEILEKDETKSAIETVDIDENDQDVAMKEEEVAENKAEIKDSAVVEDDVQPMECEIAEISSDTIEKEGDSKVPKDDDEEKKTEIEPVVSSATSDTDNKEAAKEQEMGSVEISIQSPSKTKISSSTSQKDVENIVDLADSEDEVVEVPKAEVVPSAAEATETKPELESKKQSEVQKQELETLPVKPDEPVQPKELAVETVSKQDDTADTDMHVEMLEDEVLNEEETPMETADNSEIFNLDSDDEELKSASTEVPQALKSEDQPTERKETESPDWKCVNTSCEKIPGSRWYAADASSVAYYNGGKRSREFVCEHCANHVTRRNEDLIEGIRNLTPLLELDMAPFSVELVEISDSDSEHEDDIDDLKEKIGERGAKFVEEHLEDLLNDTWDRIQMDTRLADTESVLQMEMRRIEKETDEINKFLNECQATTDRIRNEVYATFPQNIKSVPPLVIYDTPEHKYCYIQATQAGAQATEAEGIQQPTRFSKRRMEAAANDNEVPAKRPPIPLDSTYTPCIPLEEAIAKLDEPQKPQTPQAADAESDTIHKIDDDDNVDVAVVNIISSEAAPPGLPPAGELVKAPLKAGMTLYAMKNAFGSWVRSTVLEVYPKGAPSQSFTSCKVRLGTRNLKTAILPARNLAYPEPATARMTIGTRVIALFKDKHSQLKKESFYSGIVAEVPNPVNRYRYLIFFDDGYAQYANHADTRLICECHALVWEEVHPFSREFVKEYLLAYPERPMVRLHPFQSLKTEWNGKWWSSRVVTVDASLVQVHFPVHNRYEWIYRGSTRLAPLYLELQAAERHRSRPMPRTQAHIRANMPVVEYTRHEFEQSKTSDAEKAESPRIPVEAEKSRRAVAKKSTVSVAAPAPAPAPAPRPARPTGPNLDNVTSRVVYYTPKNAVKPHKLVPHTCGPHCKRTDVLSLKELRTYNPLAKPLLSGWERQIVRFKGQKAVLYRAPCGRRIRDVHELHRYLRAVECDLPVDLFDFAPHTHCLAEFVLNKCLIMKKDLSQGKENVPVPCVNYYDQTLPEFCSYNTERTPTAGVPLNLDPEFLCGCDCEDDCEDKTKCACWKLTLEGARTIGLEGDNVGYVYKRLPEPLPSGIYECNSRCKCKHTCLNRVAQHPLQLKLQVFKTLNRGWGIRALNDVPKGAFLCVYAGNLLTDATANLDGLNEGDEYLAELDYIEVVEQMKEGYEEDIPETIKKLDQLQVKKAPEIEDEESSDDDQPTSKNEMEDDDFRPGYIGLGVSEFSKRLRRRDRKTKEEKKAEAEKEKEKEKEKEEQKKEEKVNNEDDCITISDDDEVREPSRFAAAAGMGANEFVSKYRSVRTLFGEDESCYIMDAKVQGNIGRYLNHSCSPNVFVQNVFVDTHDPRFPWVAFFALSHVRAGTELTWNYNYDVGSVPGKALYCYCGAANCRGRLL